MAIFRGVGGSGDSSDNSYLQEVTAQANAASASASAASASASAASASASAASSSASSILNLTAATGAAGTEASYDASTGVLTVPRGADGSDASVTAANVTGVLTGGTGISIASNGTITNDSPDQTVSLTGAGGTSVTGTYPNFTITSSSTLTDAQIKTAYENNADTNAFTDADYTKLDGIEASADVTDTANVTSAGAAMLASSPTFTGTITAPNVDITHTGNASVTTNIATGGGTSGNTKVLNLGTGYGFGGTTTVNIGSSTPNSINTINLNGNVTIGGTLNGGTYERTVRTRFQKRGYTNFIVLNNLTSTYAQIGDTIRKDADVTVPVEHTLDLNITAQFSDINSTNDGDFIVEVYAPTPSDESTINLGSVTVSVLGQAVVSGDVTKHLSPYCGLSKNSDGSNAFGFNNSDGWWYNESTDETTIYFYPYQANTPSTGDTLYLHPFDWETLGTAVVGDSYPLDAYNANGNVHQNQFIQIYLGYFKTDKSFIIRAKEQSTSENIGITRLSGTYTQIIGT